MWDIQYYHKNIIAGGSSNIGGSSVYLALCITYELKKKKKKDRENEFKQTKSRL